jgi:hypothetical protein
VVGSLTAGQIFMASDRFGKALKRYSNRVLRKQSTRSIASPFRILQD